MEWEYSQQLARRRQEQEQDARRPDDEGANAKLNMLQSEPAAVTMREPSERPGSERLRATTSQPAGDLSWAKAEKGRDGGGARI